MTWSTYDKHVPGMSELMADVTRGLEFLRRTFGGLNEKGSCRLIGSGTI